MKKLIACIIALLALSCSISDDTQKSYVELLPVESAYVPDEFTRGEIYDITITFKRPSECHAFKDIYLKDESDGLFIAVMSTVFTGNYDCPLIDNVIEKTFTFQPGQEDLYVFKFWHGSTNSGDEEYIIIEVPVID
tara:strand:+ start:185 stop:592 length:408 start_codon:yes stop_codon:yes gene_type:complete